MNRSCLSSAMVQEYPKLAHQLIQLFENFSNIDFWLSIGNAFTCDFSESTIFSRRRFKSGQHYRWTKQMDKINRQTDDAQFKAEISITAHLPTIP
jgi:hypothetical protein